METNEGFSWNFECPTYVNFAAAHSGDDHHADKWFDMDHEVMGPQRVSDNVFSTGDSNLPLAAEGKTDEPVVESAEPTKQTKAPVSNIAVNLAEWRGTVQKKSVQEVPTKSGSEPSTRTTRSMQPPQRVRSTSIDRSATRSQKRSLDSPSVRKGLPGSPSVRKGSLGTIQTDSTLKRTNSFTRPTKSSMLKRSSSLRSKYSSTESMNTSNESVTKAFHPPTSQKKGKLTLPHTPQLIKRMKLKFGAALLKDSEQMELDKISAMRKEIGKKRKKRDETYHKAMTATGYMPVISTKGTTKPEGFQFETDARVKTHEMETRSDHREFAETLRSGNDRPPSLAARRPTVPQPFHLTESRKRKIGSSDDEPQTKYMSMAEQVNAFHSRTPDRFRSSRRGPSVNCKGRSASRSPPRVTIPKTPNFETRSRIRPMLVPSQRDLEDQEIEEMKRNQFTAKPVNKKIFTNPNSGVPEVQKKSVTIPDEFNLRGNHKDHQNKSTEDEKYEFHARPVSKRILDGVVGVKPALFIPATIPASPAFALKNRVRLPIEPKEEEEIFSLVKANPVPHSGVPFQPTISHKHTVLDPFSFEQRDRSTSKRKIEKIKQTLEEEKKAREFQANPLPSPSVAPLPDKQTKAPVKPEPFQLSVDVRGTKRAEEWRKRVEEELQQQRDLARFKAQPCNVVQQKPFKPQKSKKPLTTVNTDIELYTERRAVERDEYENIRKAKEVEIEGQKHLREKRQAEEDQDAIAKLRNEMVHKANPVKHYRAVQVLGSRKPLTEAASPQFSTRFRKK